MVDEFIKQNGIKPILFAPCVCMTRLEDTCLAAEDGLTVDVNVLVTIEWVNRQHTLSTEQLSF